MSWRDETWKLAASKEKAAATLVLQDGKILLLKRGATAPWMPGKWNLPGGTVEPDESVEAAAIREAQEEVSIHIRGLKKLFTKDFPDFQLTVFWTEQFSGQLHITWENSEMRWVSPDEAIKLDLVPGVRAAISQLSLLI